MYRKTYTKLATIQEKKYKGGFMKIALLLIGLLLAAKSSFAGSNIKTVPSVDLARFAGVWYQQARNPIVFEPECACARQVLAPIPSGQISVYNSCNKSKVSGPLQEIKGKAWPDDSTNSKITVDFGFKWKGEYWIIALDSAYRYAVVTDHRAYSLYILSKTPVLDKNLYDKALSEAATQVDISRLIKTEQNGCSYPSLLTVN